MSLSISDLQSVYKSINFSAMKHSDQRRKDKEETPYINHPLGVANILVNEGGVYDPIAIMAANLHDTVEDTDTKLDEIEQEFGREVRIVVAEVTDDKSLSKERRKQLQIEHVPHISTRGKLVKLADKLHNLRDLIANPPEDYTLERIRKYCTWARAVLEGARGTNAALEKLLDDEIFNATFVFQGKTFPCCMTPGEDLSETMALDFDLFDQSLLPHQTERVHQNIVIASRHLLERVLPAATKCGFYLSSLVVPPRPKDYGECCSSIYTNLVVGFSKRQCYEPSANAAENKWTTLQTAAVCAITFVGRVISFASGSGRGFIYKIPLSPSEIDAMVDDIVRYFKSNTTASD